MKLSGREATRYFRNPDTAKAGLLIYGADAMRVALRRQEVIRALVGPEGEAEMRLERIPAAELRKDPARLLDAVKAQGFFPGQRAVLVEDATDGLRDAITTALDDWRPGDAQIVVTAGQLNARSALRKAFEGAPLAVAIGIYDDPPSREEIEAAIRDAGLTRIDGGAMADIEALSRVLDPGDFRQTLERIGLYKLGDETPLSSEEVAALAPNSSEAGIDEIIGIVAETRSGDIGPVLARLRDQGVTPVSLCIAATRHFRALHAAASDPAGPAAGVAKLRPPVYGPRRDRIQRQAQSWGARRLEQALAILLDTDLTLRSASRAPEMSVIERTLIRLAMLGAS